MAPPITVDDQNKFLIAYIRNSNHGKIYFSKVAEECNIVNNAAAGNNSAKRYERILKAQSSSVTKPSSSSVHLEFLHRKNGISKLANKRAAKAGLRTKMKKRLEEEKCLNDAITHEADALTPRKEPEALRSGDDTKTQLSSQG